MLSAAAWQVTKRHDITDAYVRWYAALVERITARRKDMECLAGSDGFHLVHERLRRGQLAGYIVYADRLQAAASAFRIRAQERMPLW